MSMPPEGREPTEEELREAMAAQYERTRVQDLIAQFVVDVVNFAANKGGLGQPPGTPGGDLEQLRVGIEAARALLPLVEAEFGPEAPKIAEALSQLQLEYVRRSGGEAPEGGAPGGAPPSGGPGQPQPPQRQQPRKPDPPSRLWVPGQ